MEKNFVSQSDIDFFARLLDELIGNRNSLRFSRFENKKTKERQKKILSSMESLEKKLRDDINSLNKREIPNECPFSELKNKREQESSKLLNESNKLMHPQKGKGIKYDNL